VSHDVFCDENPASCKIFTVIGFLHVDSMSAADIHCELFVVYDQNAMSEETIVECSKMGEQTICQGWHFTISEWFRCTKKRREWL
jgi:hypothetical protein